MSDNTSFLGTGWAFPPAFNKDSGSIAMASDEEDILQSMQVILSTIPGERILNPDFGINTERLLFEPLDTTLKTLMKDLINRSILEYEPRVILDQVELEPSPEEGLIAITIAFTIKATNSKNNLVYPFYLNEGTIS